MKKVPVARQKRRRKVQAAVALGMGLVGVALIGAVAWLAVTLFKPPPIQSTHDIYGEIVEITNNPYTWAEPNFMGLPVSGSAVYVIDSSSAMRSHIDLVKRAAFDSIGTLGPTQPVQVVFCTENAPTVYPEEPTPAGKIDAEALASMLDTVIAAGAAESLPAFTRALRSNPNQVTLVCRSLPEPSVVEALKGPLDKSDTALVVIHLDGSEDDPEAAAWKKLAEGSDGRYIALNSARLRTWAEAANQPQEGPPATPANQD
jgi:hypothetical protein